MIEDNRLRGLPEIPIFVMLDEFQDVLRIGYSDGRPADTVGLYRWAVEGRKCPHFVTGSAVRLITQEVLGTGALFGRFRYLEFPPIEDVYGLEKEILFYAAQYEDQRIVPEEIAARVNRPREEVFYVLQQLAFAEMIGAGGGYIFRNLKDPILREFIRVQYQLDVAQQPFAKVYRELRAELARWRGKYADAVGALVEARIAALMNRFDGRRVPGRLFHVAGDVELPKFNVVYDTVVKGPGEQMRQAGLNDRVDLGDIQRVARAFRQNCDNTNFDLEWGHYGDVVLNEGDAGEDAEFWLPEGIDTSSVIDRPITVIAVGQRAEERSFPADYAFSIVQFRWGLNGNQLCDDPRIAGDCSNYFVVKNVKITGGIGAGDGRTPRRRRSE